MTTYFTREDYMLGKVSHQDYYRQFATPGVRDIAARFIARHSKRHPDLSGVPLRIWDAHHPCIQGSVGSVAVHVVPYPYHPGRFVWSLSDSVCTLKAAVDLLLEEAKAKEGVAHG